MLIVRIKNKLERLIKISVYFLKSTFNLKKRYSPFSIPNLNMINDVNLIDHLQIDKDFLQNIYLRKFSIFFKHNKSFINNRFILQDKFNSLTNDIDYKDYKFIDWHFDPYFNIKWNNDKFFWMPDYFPKKGSDIKIPRELSRFNHITLLAIGNKEENCKEFLLQITDWIVNNNLYKGLNWACNMDVALRVTNWIIGLNLFRNQISKYPNILKTIFNSIEDHGNFIYDNLEYYGEKYPTENHYLSNIVGLIYIGVNFPGMKNSKIWLRFGIQELISEMEKQVNNDGVNYESSNGYHRLVGELFLSSAMIIEKLSIKRKTEIINFKNYKIKRYKNINSNCSNLTKTNLLLPDEFYLKLLKMSQFTFSLTKPNGNIFQFGDNDSGRAHVLDPINEKSPLNHSHFVKSVAYFLNQKMFFNKINSNNKEYLFYGKINGKINLHTDFDFNSKDFFFKESGIVVQKNTNSWLGVICMPNGKSGNGGHNHNDKLSFELNIFGQDFIVDGGCPFYTNYPVLRNSFRSTHAHSTVAVEGLEQDNWVDGPSGLFKLLETCNPKIEVDKNNIIVGSHSGYGSDHIRKFNLNENKLIIEDFLEIKNKKKMINFNLAENLIIDNYVKDSNVIFELKSPKVDKLIKLEITNVTNPLLKKGFLSEGYNNPKDNFMISCEMSSSYSRSTFSW